MAKSRTEKPKKPPEGECVIPTPVPHDAIPGLMVKRATDEEQSIRDYVEWQASGETVTHLEKVTTETLMGQRYHAWDVYTDKERWWVITPPTNLYRQKDFPSLDYMISFHIGLMARVMSQRQPGVAPMEQEMLAVPWRRWEQAAEALDEADEAEEFQAVGMRCRECFIAMVKSMGRGDIVPAGQQPPKRSDVVNWCELIANDVAKGASAEEIRKYLKATSKTGWQLVNWLTHSENATRTDGEFAIGVTQHILAMFSAALFRQKHGIPDRCPKCGSYKTGLRQADASDEAEPVPACQVCGWIKEIPRTRAATADEAAQVAAKRQRTATAAITAATKKPGEEGSG